MANIVIREVQKGYQNKLYYDFYVLIPGEGENSILYHYERISEDDLENEIPKNALNPSRKAFIKAKNYEEFRDYKKKNSHRSYYSYSSESHFEEVKKTPEECNLLTPEIFYGVEEIKIVESRDEIITDTVFEKIKNKCSDNYTIILGENIEASNGKDYNSSLRIYCSKCKKIHNGCGGSHYNGYSCPDCGHNYGFHLTMKDFKDYQKKSFGNKKYAYNELYGFSYSQKEKFNIVSTHPDDENGIILYGMYKEINANKGVIKIHYGIEYAIEHVVGKKISCTKYLKKCNKEWDAFEALNINTKNLYHPCSLIYDDADDFFEFAAKHEKFLRMSGFQTALKYSNLKLNLEGFFIVFLAILNKYPIMEQIVKMGHSKIFFMLYEDMRESLNRDEINNHVDKISQLVNNEASKGKDALRFPMYIGDYLIKKGADLEEYYYWRDIYEITNISKEQFENLTDSINYAYINTQSSISNIGNILKFDYSVEKLLNYIVKTSIKTNYTIGTTVQYLIDYLNMCDICQIEPDKYPQDLRKVHDDMTEFYRKREKATYDLKLHEIGTECEEYVIPKEDELNKIGIPKMFNDMVVVFPKSEEDFINEGNQQHNCVGSYPNSVRNGRCVIFFIRHKNEPLKSYITAECTSKGLGQCFYSNNRYVNDEELRKFAQYVCTKINSGVKSGKIHALGNI